MNLFSFPVSTPELNLLIKVSYVVSLHVHYLLNESDDPRVKCQQIMIFFWLPSFSLELDRPETWSALVEREDYYEKKASFDSDLTCF